MAASWSRDRSHILQRTRREVCAELGVGEGAQRRDRAWATSVRVEHFDEVMVPAQDDETEDPFWQVTALLIEAIDDGAIGVFDAWLIGELARIAHAFEAPGHRGRLGLTTPAVVDHVAQDVRLSTRALRRRAAKALDRMSEYVAVREDDARFAVWRARRRTASQLAQEEMELVIGVDEAAYWVRARSRAVDGAGHDEAAGPGRTGTA